MKHISFISFIFTIFLFSCSKKETEIGAPVSIKPDYVLPQGNAPDAANARIQQLYDKYGSYFLYNFTQKDYEWVQSTGSGNSKLDTAVLGDPIYTSDMLQFLDDVWLKFLPEDFKKGKGIPYRVFMADVIRQYRPNFPPEYTYLYFDYKIVGKAVVFPGMNSDLRTMTPAQKVAKKIIVTSAMWSYYIANNILDIPSEFYAISNYTSTAAPVTPLSLPANMIAYRTRGFLPSSYDPTFGNALEWYYSSYAWGTAKTNDANSFITNITQRTDAQMAPYLTYPLIKQKFDLLVNYYKTKYNIDVRAIANATY
ncbi:hypothetical protein ACE38W_17585 [Chitinophaga sp. Hz27]|uniref:Uncharacterized protein n=1 Tax=Chitinophaga silvatica TaxID=2282649 RepID=A0A3E1YHF4_9BACT|nr:hypothetical protein [Chitinophaga silvatica]RFS26764.1 hypothetical protein DVR12_02975 [Chitinophaga silvatica]